MSKRNFQATSMAENERNMRTTPIDTLLFNSSIGKLHCLSSSTEHEKWYISSLCVLVLQSEEVCLFHGQAKLTHLFGRPIQLMGTTITADPEKEYIMFSPNSHASITFNQSLASKNEPLLLSSESLSSAFDKFFHSNFDPKSCKSSLLQSVMDAHERDQEDVSILAFVADQKRITESLTSVKRFKDLFTLVRPKCIPDNPMLIGQLGFCFTHGRDYNGFHVSPAMHDVSATFISTHTDYLKQSQSTTAIKALQSCFLLTGPKGAGKSSLLRFLINDFLLYAFPNRLSPDLQTIAVLDCDIGQPEFTPPGMISLTLVNQPIFGPPFTHQILNNLRPLR